MLYAVLHLVNFSLAVLLGRLEVCMVCHLDCLYDLSLDGCSYLYTVLTNKLLCTDG